MISYRGEKADAEECPTCRPGGRALCAQCRRTIPPQLKAPSWHRDAHSGLWTDEKERAAESRAAAKARRREARKATRRRELAALVASLPLHATAA